MRAFSQICFALILSGFGSLALASDDGGREPARTSYTCRIVTGNGTAIGHGSTQLKAQAAAQEICGDKMIDQYYATRGSIAADHVDDLALACINLSCE